MNPIQDSIAKLSIALDTARAFAAEYDPKIPEGFPGIIGYSIGGKIRFYCAAPYSYGDKEEEARNRETLLAGAGELFGKTGWTRELNCDNTKYHWQREILGVLVHLEDAEVIPPPPAGKVPASAFPVLLKDASA